MSNSKYRLSLAFDYNCCGCLWSENKAAFEMFDIGTQDTETYNLNGNVIQKQELNYHIQLDKDFQDLTG